MKSISEQFKSLTDSPTDYLVMLALIVLPFSILVTNIVLIGVIVRSLFTTPPTVWIERIRQHKTLLILMIAPFLFITCTLLYTSDVKAGVHELEKTVSLLLLPPVILVSRFKKSARFFAEVFSGVIVIICLVCISAGLYRFFFHDLTADAPVGDRFTAIVSPWNALTNSNLTLPFKINPIYLSLYVSFATTAIVLSKNISTTGKVLSFFLLLIFQVLLGSRIGLAAMALAGVASVFFIPAKSRRYLFLGMAGCAVAIILCVAVNPILRKRYSDELMAWEKPDKMEDWNAVSLRNAVWSCSVKVFMESPVLGKGVGGASAGRQECYKNYSFYGYFGTDFNSHNQYLEYAVTGGAVLAILFLLQLAVSFRAAVSRRDTVYFLFLLVFSIVAVGESLLEAHKGIIFFTCFNSLFLFQNSTVTDNV